MIDSMHTPTKTKLSRQEVLRAEAELLAYDQSGSGNPQQQKQLAKAVQFAIDESRGQLAKSGPKRQFQLSAPTRPFQPGPQRHSRYQIRTRRGGE